MCLALTPPLLFLLCRLIGYHKSHQLLASVGTGQLQQPLEPANLDTLVGEAIWQRGDYVHTNCPHKNDKNVLMHLNYAAIDTVDSKLFESGKMYSDRVRKALSLFNTATVGEAPDAKPTPKTAVIKQLVQESEKIYAFDNVGLHRSIRTVLNL